ncbi:MAG: 2-isopropylmalate synthase, partial [Thermoanaerobaculia bacterium]
MDETEDLIYDWNLQGTQPARPPRRVEFDDETLRDGLQSPSVTDPSLDEKIQILHFMNDIGIDNVDIGLPGAGPHVQRTVEALAREIVKEKLSVHPSAAGRTHGNDVRPIIDISQRVGIPIEADLFIGSSPIRQFTEGWDIDWIIEQSVKAVRFATENGIPVMYVTEDTTRAKPEDVEKLYTAAIDAGAKRVCICDTVGHATPWGT